MPIDALVKGEAPKEEELASPEPTEVKPKKKELVPVSGKTSGVVTLYDKDNKPLTVSNQDAAEAILSGTHGLDDKYKYNMVDSSGKAWTVPATGVKTALENGWQLGQTFSAQENQHLQTEVEKNGALGAGLKSFADAAGNSISLGALDYAKNKTQAPEQAELEHQLQAAHPTASTVGDVAGEVAGFGITTPAFGAAEAVGGALERGILGAGERALVEGMAKEGAEAAIKQGFARQLAAKTANMAAQGALLASPQAVTEAALGDPKAAGESLLWGAGLGAVLGVATAGAARAARAGGELLGMAGPKANEVADTMALKAAGIQKGGARKLGEEGMERNAKVLFDEGIIKPNASFDEIKAKVEELEKQSGEKIGEHLKAFDKLVAENPSLKQHTFSPFEAANAIENQLSKGLDNPMYSAERAELTKIVDTVAQHGGEDAQNVSFAKAQEIKNLFNKFPLSKLDPTPKEALQQQARAIVNRMIEDAASKVVNTATEEGLNVSPQLFSEYLKQKELYRASQELIRHGIENKTAGEFGNKALSLTDFIHGGFAGTVGSMIGGAVLPGIGHGVGAMAGAGINLYLKHWAEEKGLATGAYLLKKVANDPGAVPFIGPLLAHNGVQAFNRHFDGMGKLLALEAKRGVQFAGTENIKRFLGKDAAGLSKQQQFARVAQHISTLADQEALADGVAPVAGALSPYAPNVAYSYVKTVNDAVQYLKQELPKNPVPVSPFEVNDWLPSTQQIHAFDEKLGVVQDPSSIVPHIANGTVTSNQLKTLQIVYPAYYAKMKETIIKLAAEDKIHLKQDAKNKLSIVFGVPLTRTAKNMGFLQASYAAVPPTGSPQGRPGKLKDLPSAATRIQKVAEKD